MQEKAMAKRYNRNKEMITSEEQERLKKARVCVVGCGGLGGYSIEFLARLGIGYITVVDGDVFDETNLNRQVLSNEINLGKSKAHIAMQHVKMINSEVTVTEVTSFFAKENAVSIIKGHDVVVDALDNIEMRKLLQKTCSELKLPLVHGAIAGWYGQVTTLFPGDKTLDMIYKTDATKGVEKELGNPSFTPAIVSGIQVAEVLKILLERSGILRHKVLYIDLLTQTYDVLELESWQ